MLIMVDIDIGIKMPDTSPLGILEKMLMALEEVDICSRPVTLPPISQVTMLYFCLYMLLLVVSMIVFMEMKEVILGLVMEDVEVGPKRSANFPFKSTEKVLMVNREVDISVRAAPSPPII